MHTFFSIPLTLSCKKIKINKFFIQFIVSRYGHYLGETVNLWIQPTVEAPFLLHSKILYIGHFENIEEIVNSEGNIGNINDISTVWYAIQPIEPIAASQDWSQQLTRILQSFWGKNSESVLASNWRTLQTILPNIAQHTNPVIYSSLGLSDAIQIFGNGNHQPQTPYLLISDRTLFQTSFS